MNNKVIDFKKSKERLMNKKFPNVSPIIPEGKQPFYLESNKALDKFQTILCDYQEYLLDRENKKEIKLEEVLVYFNRYFDAIYKELTGFDDSKVPKFKEAMDYAMLSNGKRLRPFLMLLTYNFCEGEDFLLISPLMVAMELIHTFSLVHDDLPCMDNDELRRGKPTVWKKYGEDIAVLVGDALYMEATSILMDMVLEFLYTEIGSYVATSAAIIIKLAGLDGMITGQVFDVMNTTNDKLTIDDICYMYDKKTTALLTASMIVGANMSSLYNGKAELIERLGICLGESYQIKDDLLEIEQTTEKIGKSVDSDKKNNKVTYVGKVGIEESKHRLEQLFKASMGIIDSMTTEKNKKESLVFKELIKYLMSREK
ncbi:MAG: polyprenyl synthetase family protein [Lachnospiraceae bacterium]|nr:polyprenyl synthetase family protein [Lachnospiraceae bacterium]